MRAIESKVEPRNVPTPNVQRRLGEFRRPSGSWLEKDLECHHPVCRTTARETSARANLLTRWISAKR